MNRASGRGCVFEPRYLLTDRTPYAMTAGKPFLGTIYLNLVYWEAFWGCNGVITEELSDAFGSDSNTVFAKKQIRLGRSWAGFFFFFC